MEQMPGDDLIKTSLVVVGVVRNSVTTSQDRDWGEVQSEIVVSEQQEQGLAGIDDFSHLIVVYWMHLLCADERNVLRVHPRRRPELPRVGVFATRSPARPNPIGVTVVRLLSRQRNVLKVAGLDALDGTPVLDIKPYLPEGDCIPSARFAPWVGRDMK